MWMEGEKRVGEIKKEIRVGCRLWKTLAAVLWVRPCITQLLTLLEMVLLRGDQSKLEFSPYH